MSFSIQINLGTKREWIRKMTLELFQLPLVWKSLSDSCLRAWIKISCYLPYFPEKMGLVYQYHSTGSQINQPEKLLLCWNTSLQELLQRLLKSINPRTSVLLECFPFKRFCGGYWNLASHSVLRAYYPLATERRLTTVGVMGGTRKII